MKCEVCGREIKGEIWEYEDDKGNKMVVCNKCVKKPDKVKDKWEMKKLMK